MGEGEGGKRRVEEMGTALPHEKIGYEPGHDDVLEEHRVPVTWTR